MGEERTEKRTDGAGPELSAEEILKRFVQLAEELGVDSARVRRLLELGLRALDSAEQQPGPIYDSMFRTVVARLGRLNILLVNRLFDMHFTGEEEVEYSQTEVAERTVEGEIRSIRSDSHFTIVGLDGKRHRFHIECQMKRDGTLFLRIVEYNLMLALAEAQEQEWGWELQLPNSGVILLRSSEPSSKSPWTYRITGKDGRYVEQQVRTVSLPQSSVEDLFQQELYALLPFYLFTHGSDLKKLEKTAAGQEKLMQELGDILERIANSDALDEGEKARLRELISRVAGAVIKDRDLKARMEDTMIPGILELQADKWEAAWKEEGEAKGRTAVAVNLLRAGLLTPEQISAVTAIPLTEIEAMASETMSGGD